MSKVGSPKTHLAVLVALAALGGSPWLMAADESPEGAQTAATPAQAAPSAANPEAPAQDVPAEAPKNLTSHPEAPPLVEPEGAEGTPEGAPEATGEGAPATAESIPEKPPEPVTGAFGLRLGDKFDAAMVEKVLGEEQKAYRVADKTERQGILYRVVPKAPDPNYTTYTVAVTEDGIIYRIDAEYTPPERSSRCAVTKEIAAALVEKYGKPRGRGAQGKWYSFRDMTADGYRGIRLTAVRCGRGIYSISYEDATLTRGPLPGQARAKAPPEERKHTRIKMSGPPGAPGKGPKPGPADESEKPTDAEPTTEAAEPGTAPEPAPPASPSEPPKSSESPTPEAAPGT